MNGCQAFSAAHVEVPLFRHPGARYRLHLSPTEKNSGHITSPQLHALGQLKAIMNHKCLKPPHDTARVGSLARVTGLLAEGEIHMVLRAHHEVRSSDTLTRPRRNDFLSARHEMTIPLTLPCGFPDPDPSPLFGAPAMLFKRRW